MKKIKLKLKNFKKEGLTTTESLNIKSGNDGKPKPVVAVGGGLGNGGTYCRYDFLEMEIVCYNTEEELLESYNSI